MHKLLAAIVVSTFALGSVSGFAADAVKKEELTQEQRSEMRNRADQLVKARAAGTTQAKTVAPKAKPQHVKKVKKVSRQGVTKARPPL